LAEINLAEYSAELIRHIERGFSFKALQALESRSGLAALRLASIMRTLARRKASGRLSPDESERLLRISSIVDDAVNLFEGDVGSAVKWLTTPRKTLGNQPPLAYSRTELGALEVESLIGRLEPRNFLVTVTACENTPDMPSPGRVRGSSAAVGTIPEPQSSTPHNRSRSPRSRCWFTWTLRTCWRNMCCLRWKLTMPRRTPRGYPGIGDPIRLNSGLSATNGSWREVRRSFRVPSALVLGESNFLLNPGHPDFAKLRIGKPLPFRFDSRLK
jgi:putative toxin-antitoxin system antitoxin component (TIGR02293 family)